MYKPELLNTFKNYSAAAFSRDAIAGIIVGIVALPLSIAFAIASGCSPETGLYTAIIAGFCIAAFGGTKCQIGGPTGAFTVIIYAIVNNKQLGVSGLATATVLAGVMLILLGAFKMGGLVKFIPYTIVVGFTAGIAVTIASGQIGDFFGLAAITSENPVVILGEKFEKMPGEFHQKIIAYTQIFNTINPYSTAMALISLVALFMWPKVTKKIPGSLIVIILATVIHLILNKTCGFETVLIGDRYKIPSSLPTPSAPDFSFTTIRTVFPTAVSIAILAAIESLLSAVVADGMIGAKHDSNNELIGQGIANIFSPLFGGLPATGAIARTATNINNGGRTPVAGIIHAMVLLLIMIFFGKYVEYIPMAALAAVLIQVAWNMAGIPSIRKLLKGQKSDITVLLVTFLITVFVDLTYAIGIGLLFAAFFFIKKIIDLSEVQDGSRTIITGIRGDGSTETIDLPKGVMVYEIEGSLFFGTVRKFEYAIERAGSDCKAIIFRMRNLIYLDAGGIQALEQAKAACDRKGITIILSGIHTQPYLLCEKSGMSEKLGKENICANINAALERAKAVSAS
ncbi:MAG: SulP family inorganic anion transporter [Treponema sp.]|nr:SulP family inorganic anion transporter [Spirochaetia bacterium]MDD7580372.1 SulP family inorganic anion transporter [Treponema sp.]MDY3759329.1 SulP family inorganic anion transporter [Treponema sp.]MDY4130678.1 SulP family inorganic anion transporter [Treponema sp.]MDY5837793.1 SulP family inorganic anion transporter [Treponema sp.]